MDSVVEDTAENSRSVMIAVNTNAERIKIHWQGFLKHAVEEHPKEAAGFLFSRKPYSSEEEWYVFTVKNASDDPCNSWFPDRKDMQRIKAKAIRMGLVKIGNVHTHPYPPQIPFNEEELSNLLKPSTPDNKAVPEGFSDLDFARKFNDVIRGILVVNNDTIYGCKWHDKFGNNIDVKVISDEQK